MSIFITNKNNSGNSHRVEALLNRYKKLATSEMITKNELIEYLKNTISAFAVDFTLIDSTTRKGLLLDIELYIKSHEITLNIDDLEFLTYIIPNSGVGVEYYTQKYVPIKITNYGNNLICAIFERHLEHYINCNCNKLFLDLSIKRGVSQHDYENNTLVLIDYLSKLEALDNKWY